MKLTTLPNKILRQKSLEVTFPLDKETKNLIENMISHIDESQEEGSTKRSGVGLSAVQFGSLKRLFYVNMDVEDLEPMRILLINPEIVAIGSRWAALDGGEGCLSIEDTTSEKVSGLVHRKNKVIIRGWSYFDNKVVEITKSGYPAIIIQHEMDHLDGKLFVDRINHKNRWDTKDMEILI